MRIIPILAMAMLVTLPVMAQERTANTPYSHDAGALASLPNCADDEYLTKQAGSFLCKSLPDSGSGAARFQPLANTNTIMDTKYGCQVNLSDIRDENGNVIYSPGIEVTKMPEPVGVRLTGTIPACVYGKRVNCDPTKIKHTSTCPTVW